MDNFYEALDRGVTHQALDHTHITALLGANEAQRALLYNLADRVRTQFVGDAVHLRGIIEFSNYCSGGCRYCGLRSGNRAIARYRMELPEILEAARGAAALGLKTIVLQSGEDPYYTVEKICGIIASIKGEMDVAVTLSLGMRPRQELAAFRRAGADRYLLKHETADAGLFAKMRPGTFLEDRVGCLKVLKELGFQAGSGFMVGLPGQNLGIMARDIELLRRLEVEMAGMGPFVPSPGTPLGGYPGGNLEGTLIAIAVTRLVLPGINIPATTALGTIHPKGRQLALGCGANVVMPNVTPLKYRRHYAIYPNKSGIDRDAEVSVQQVLSLLEEIGRPVGRGYGAARAIIAGEN